MGDKAAVTPRPRGMGAKFDAKRTLDADIEAMVPDIRARQVSNELARDVRIELRPEGARILCDVSYTRAIEDDEAEAARVQLHAIAAKYNGVIAGAPKFQFVVSVWVV